jgi:sec-independent protein translocase protein TatA
MGSFSIWHLLILALVVFVLFGRGKVSDLMGDFAKGIKNFKKGLAEDEEHEGPRVISSDNHRTDTQSTVHHDETKEKAGH